MLRRSRVGAEHILYGLIMEHSGTAASALRSLGVDLHVIERHLWPYLSPGFSSKMRANPPFAESAKNVMKYANEECGGNPDTRLGTAQLLLGLLRAMPNEESLRKALIRRDGAPLEYEGARALLLHSQSQNRQN